MKHLGLLLPAWLMGTVCGLAQDSRIRDVNSHSWWVYTGDHPLRGRWGLFAELQLRRSELGLNWQQLQSRNALSYRISPNLQIAGGYVWTWTDRYGDNPLAARPFGEHRTYEQIAVTHRGWKFNLEHRLRFEQRWLQVFTSTAHNAFFWRHQHRVRYQLKVTHPIAEPWYLFGGSEVFLGFAADHGANVFDQNRGFGGVGYKVNPKNRLEIGYMNQFLVQRNGLVEESNHTLRIQFTSTIGLLGRN